MKMAKNDGFAVVYGLAVLFLASVSGMSILYVSNKDRISVEDHSKIRSAASAARAALDAFEGQCQSQPDEVLKILKKFNQNSSNKWLLGSSGNASKEHRFKSWDGGDAPLFSANIMRFDSVNMLLQVQGNGFGGFGGKKRAIGIYKLKGLKNDFSWRQKEAIYLAGEGRNIDFKINVNGDVFFGGDVHFNGSAIGSVINGDFKTGNSTKKSEFDVPITINGNALFQTSVEMIGSIGISINGKAGFEKSLYTNPDIHIYGDAYVNNSITGTGRLDLHNNSVTYSGLFNPITSKFYNSSPAPINNNGKIDIPSMVDMSSEDNPHLIAGLNNIPSNKILKVSSYGWNNVSAFELQSQYNYAAANGMLWNGFMVLNVDKLISMQASPVPFTGKVIWIVDKQITCNRNWYNCSATSNTLVYVRSGGYVENLGSGTNFRGYVYVEGNGRVTYSWANGNSFTGAVHHVSKTAGFHLNSGETWNITFDMNVINEFIDIGVMQIPGTQKGVMVLNDIKLRPELLSISY